MNYGKLAQLLVFLADNKNKILAFIKKGVDFVKKIKVRYF